MLKRMTSSYTTLAVVGVAAGFVLMGGMVSSADEAGTAVHNTRGSPNVNTATIEAKIAQAKAALRLTPAQERHWPRVAAVIHSIGRQRVQAGPERSSEPARRGAAGAARVLAAAAPLIKTLDAEQRQAALSLVRSLGYGHLASGL